MNTATTYTWCQTWCYFYLFIYFCTVKISEPSNVKSELKPLFETSAVIITWDASTYQETGSNNNEDIQYFIKYCEINKESTCVNTSLSNSRRVELTNLKKNFIYNYHVYPIGKENVQGVEYNSIFRTGLKSKLTNH